LKGAKFEEKINKNFIGKGRVWEKDRNYGVVSEMMFIKKQKYGIHLYSDMKHLDDAYISILSTL